MVNGHPNFWLDNNSPQCREATITNKVSFQNGQSRGICHPEFDSLIDLADGYTNSKKFWGEFYYKTYGEMTAEEARAKCEADGASLPVPLSSFENDFYASLYPDGQVWLGLTTTHEGYTLITNTFDGFETGYTAWGNSPGLEFMFAQNTSSSGASVYIETLDVQHEVRGDMNYWNNNKGPSDLANTVCVYKIDGKIYRVSQYILWSGLSGRYHIGYMLLVTLNF